MVYRVALVLTLLFALPIFAQQDVMEHARRLQSQVLGIDGHNDSVQRVFYDHADLAQRSSQGQLDIPRLRDGGMHAPFFALWVPTYYHGAEAVRRTLDLRDAMQRLFDQHPDQIELATTAGDLERIVKSGKIAATLTVEGGHQIDNDLAVLRMYYRMGVRGMTLTHFRNNDWADSSTDKPEHNGLTDFGRQVVREMNRLGMIVDVSHVSDKTFYDAVQTSTKPVIASHSGCRALSDVPRNMTDDMLRALAKNGGVVGINFGAGFVNDKDAAGLRADINKMAAAEPNLSGRALDEYAERDYRKDLGKGTTTANATVKDVADQIDHVVKVAGIDHVGIGSDFDGITTVPKGLEDVSKLPALTAELIRRGYSDDDIRKIMGGNFLRVMRAVIGK